MFFWLTVSPSLFVSFKGSPKNFSNPHNVHGATIILTILDHPSKNLWLFKIETCYQQKHFFSRYIYRINLYHRFNFWLWLIGISSEMTSFTVFRCNFSNFYVITHKDYPPSFYVIWSFALVKWRRCFYRFYI